MDDESNIDSGPDQAGLESEDAARWAPRLFDASLGDHSQLTRLAYEFRGLEVTAEDSRRMPDGGPLDGDLA